MEYFLMFILVLLIAGLAASILRDGRLNDRHKRAMLAKWFCPECGYRVHATPADRCPECGTRIPPKFPPYGPDKTATPVTDVKSRPQYPESQDR